MSDNKVNIEINSGWGKKKVEDIKIKVSNKIKDGGELVIHNNGIHGVSVWFTNEDRNDKNDSTELFKQWDAFTDDVNELHIASGAKTSAGKIVLNPRGAGFHFFLQVNFGQGRKKGVGHGGGLTKSKEIEVTPP